MNRRGKSRARAAAAPGPNAPRSSLTGPHRTLSGWKLWRLRLLLLFGLPMGLLAFLELILRLSGFGYPTAFLLPDPIRGRQMLKQNNQFGWRFFGARMSRLPYPCSISKTKPPGTVRIFVFGESAAYGDPRPAFGLSRMLEATLSLRYPKTRFEVVNAAMTGINSHTILPIARDCAHASGDIWVIYMGNNEVVGPFGAGTVFGRQAPPLPLVHCNLALKTLRVGQLLDSMRQWGQKPPPEKSEWGGMLMFLDHQVRSEDPRMTTVYDHFQRNLADILRAGKECGCGIVVSTMAVNLKDCAPFASAHRPGFSENEQQQWDQFFKQGVEAQRNGEYQIAADHFTKAAQLDDTFAEMRFRQGECSLALGRTSEAEKHFSAARDFDTLRFRCDARLNDLIREAAADRTRENILLADSERAFAEQSPQGLPGFDLFYEHVHLKFDGNYLLAKTIASQVEKLLPVHIAGTVSHDLPWPSSGDCARRLAWNEVESKAAFNEMLVRLTDPPFTTQLNHDRQVAQLSAHLKARPPADVAGGLAADLKACEQACAAAPGDPILLEELASLKQSTGDLPGAVEAMQRSLELLPSNSQGWAHLGMLLVQQHKFEEAASAFRRELSLDSQDVSALQNLAMCMVKENHLDEAILEYRRTLSIKPRFGPAWLGLGQVLERSGQQAEALECFHKALANRMHRGPDLATLARFCSSRGWYEAAVTNYIDALSLSPPDASLNYEAGQSLAALGHHREAAQHFASAAALAPDWAQAQFQCGLELGQSGQPEQAAARFKEAIRLMPELLEARLNLGIALTNQKLYQDALEQFEQVIQRSPTNAVARQYIAALRRTVSAEHQ